MCPRLNFIQYIYNVLRKQQQQQRAMNLGKNSLGSVALEKKNHKFVELKQKQHWQL